MTTLRLQRLKSIVVMIVTMPLYIFFAYIFVLGFKEFHELHLSGILTTTIFGCAFPIVVGGVISWRVIQAKRAFIEGLREGHRHNTTSR